MLSCSQDIKFTCKLGLTVFLCIYVDILYAYLETGTFDPRFLCLTAQDIKELVLLPIDVFLDWYGTTEVARSAAEEQNGSSKVTLLKIYKGINPIISNWFVH